jgi:hypothetical protein
VAAPEPELEPVAAAVEAEPEPEPLSVENPTPATQEATPEPVPEPEPDPHAPKDPLKRNDLPPGISRLLPHLWQSDQALRALFTNVLQWEIDEARAIMAEYRVYRNARKGPDEQ